MKDANEFVQKLGMGDPTTCVYQLIYDENDNDDTKIIKYFIMKGLGLWIEVDIYMAHMFYSLSFSHNTEVTIAINKNNYYIYFNNNNVVIARGAVTYHKTGTL